MGWASPGHNPPVTGPAGPGRNHASTCSVLPATNSGLCPPSPSTAWELSPRPTQQG